MKNPQMLTPIRDPETLQLLRRLESLNPEKHPEELLRLTGEQRSQVEGYLMLNKERRYGYLRPGL